MLRKTMPWSIKQVCTMIDKGTIKFDNPLQRPSGQWLQKDKSLLIDSILRLFIPDVYVLQSKGLDGKNTYDTIDGKQRLTEIYSFIMDEWALSDLPPVKLDTGEEYDISGKIFSELPEEVQDSIKSYSMSFRGIELEEEDDEETIVEDIFYRLNNGKAVSREHLALVSAGRNVQDFVRRMILEHPLFVKDIAKFTPNAKKKSDREITILQSIILLSGREYTNFVAKEVENFFAVNVIEDEVLEKVEQTFDCIVGAFPEKHKFVVKVNIPIMACVFANSNNVELTTDKLLEYIKTTAVGDHYRANTGAGSVKKEKVLGRIQVLSSLCGVSLEEDIEEEEEEEGVEVGEDFHTESENNPNSENIA